MLLDEIGTGTDPDEGVALGIATVDHLRQRGANVVATTHLEALKAFASSTDQWTNAAMQFDEATLTPTYRLVPGIPGRSGALEIAERLGLPRAILDAARARRGRTGEELSRYLAHLQELTEGLESQRKELRDQSARLKEDRDAMERSLREREDRHRRAIANEIELALESMRAEGARYLATLKDREMAQRLRRSEAKAASRLRAEALRLIRRVSGKEMGGSATAPIAVGDTVMVRSMGLRGTLEQVRGDRAIVSARGKRVTVPWQDCEAAGAVESDSRRSGPALPAGVTLNRAASGGPVESEIHLRGLNVEEALERIEKYLDDAWLAGLDEVRLIHGIGTGRLKQAIGPFLSSHPHAERFNDAEAERGGAGVTVVVLRA